MSKGRSQTQIAMINYNHGLEKIGCYSVGMTTFRHKKISCKCGGWGMRSGCFLKKDLGVGELHWYKNWVWANNVVLLQTGNILGCRRRIAVWKIPGQILLLCWHTEDLSCSILPSLRQTTSRRKWKSQCQKFWERAARAAEKQGVQEFSQGATGQSGRVKTERKRVCPFSYVTSKVVADRKGVVWSLCPQWTDQGEETLTCSKGASDMKENFLFMRRVRYWGDCLETGRGLCHVPWKISRVG